MFHGNVVDQLLNQHGLAHAGAAEEAYFAPSGIGLQQINDLDARLQNFHRGTLLLKGGGLAVDALHRRALGHGAAAVDGLAQHVEHPPQGGPAHRHLDGVSGHVHGQSPGQPLAGGEHDAAHDAAAHMLRHLHNTDLAVLFHRQLLPQAGERSLLDLHVHHGAGDLYDDASFQILTSSHDCAGPGLRRRSR